MNNYLKSFLITMSIYSALFALIFSNYNDELFCKEKTNTEQNRVCISMIEQKPMPTPKKINKCQKPEIVKKHKPIKKHKKIVKKVPKPIKKVIKKPLPKEEMVQKEKPVIEKETPKTEIAKAKQKPDPVPPIDEKLEEEQKKQEELQARQTQILQQKRQEELQARQDQFMAYLVERINANKSYPHMARRRAIEGDVKVMFHIFADGSVQHIKLVSGRNIFKRSAFEAITRSFPIEIDKTLFDFPKEFTVTLAYNLK